MHKLVLVRHGESTDNAANQFSGWHDADLTERGVLEARKAGEVLKQEGFEFDLGFTSVQKRSINTLRIILEEMNQDIPVKRSWRINERHYGALQGLNKSETTRKYGEAQVHQWRRSYDVPPSAQTKDDPRYSGNDPVYADLTEDEIPLTECLKDVVARFMPYWDHDIAPEIRSGKRVIISGHHNSLRAFMKYVDNMSGEEVAKLEIPYGIPIVYYLDDDLKPIKHEYLGDPEEIKRIRDEVKNQHKAR
ncbi:2,3-diphosphoglycerate-dependent phosphoglycerate mutase [Nanoarchaeota archaeon]